MRSHTHTHKTKRNETKKTHLSRHTSTRPRRHVDTSRIASAMRYHRSRESVAFSRFPPSRLDRAARYRALSRRAFFIILVQKNVRYFHMSERITLVVLFAYTSMVQSDSPPSQRNETKSTLLNPRRRARARRSRRVFVEPHRRGWLRLLSCRHAVARRGANLLCVSARRV